MKHKLKEWLLRYGPAEAISIGISIIAGLLVFAVSRNNIAVSFISPWIQNIGFYCIMAFNEYSRMRKKHGKNFKNIHYWKILRNLIIEFGPAEFFDSLIIRPFWIFVFTSALNNIALGVLAGSLLANVSFYAPTIVSYELRKKHLKD
ncbi:MAG: hypothetical protein Q7R70_06500 [Candidatus Diapherotrites archaeon]|nr:hypothetical protein [Candidatus Diapherotrites archaeon]